MNISVKGNKLALILRRNANNKAIRLPDYGITAASPVETPPLPPNVALPILQQYGEACKAIVKKGDIVLGGQKIADSEDFNATPLHASLSGEVTGMVKIIDPATGRPVDAIVITSDGEDKCIEYKAAANPESISKADMISMVREAGIIGNETDANPAHIRLSPPGKTDAVIINASQCEPYLTTNTRLMSEKPKEMLTGINIINRILSPSIIYIAIDSTRMDITDNLMRYIKHSGADYLKIVLLEQIYPYAAEGNLVNIIFGENTKPGVALFDASTVLAINDAVINSKPFIEKTVTLAGSVSKAANLRVRIGTPISHIIDYCGGIKDAADKIIINGLLSGSTVYDQSFPVTKETNSIILGHNVTSEEGDCIRCGKCIEICPARLSPTLLAAYAKAGRYNECKEAYVDNCFECGACSYICPSNIPILQYLRVAKSELGKKVAM